MNPIARDKCDLAELPFGMQESFARKNGYPAHARIANHSLQNLASGFAIRYTPRAVCWHRHRRTEAELLQTMRGYSVGVCAFLFRCLFDHHDWQALRVGAGWFVGHHLRNVARALLARPGAVPLRYTAAEIKGVAYAWWAYRKTRKAERDFRPDVEAEADAA